MSAVLALIEQRSRDARKLKHVLDEAALADDHSLAMRQARSRLALSSRVRAITIHPRLALCDARNGAMEPVRVFLSSTAKDLRDCREAVAHAINRLDGFRCVRMEEFGARDVQSAELCRQRVLECELYVGLIGHCYGSPVQGTKLSFTELEYRTAVEAGKSRLIFLASDAFLVIAAAVTSETQATRRKQLEFRAELKHQRQVDEFTTAEELAIKVVSAVHNWKERDERVYAPGHSPTTVVAGDAEKLSGSVVTEPVVTADVLHTFLVTQAILSSTTHGLLTTHEVNLAYRFRKAMALQSKEEELLHATLFADTGCVTPGWFWLKNIHEDALSSCLWWAAYRFPDCRRGALALVKKAAIGLPVDAAARVPVIEALLADESYGVASVVLDVLASAGDPSYVDLGQRLALPARQDAKEEFVRYVWSTRIKKAPDAAFQELLLLRDDPGVALDFLLPLLAEVPLLHLRRGLQHTVGSIRRICTRELSQRHGLTTSEARAILDGRDVSLFPCAYGALLAGGECVEAADVHAHIQEAGSRGSSQSQAGNSLSEQELDALMWDVLSRRSNEELEQGVGWFERDGDIAYRILAERCWESRADQVRGDIRDRFASLRTRGYASLRETVTKEVRRAHQLPDGPLPSDYHMLVTSALAVATGASEGVSEFIEGRYLQAAMACLVKHPETQDLSLARNVLEHTKEQYYGAGQLEAVTIVGQLGSGDDVSWLDTIVLNLDSKAARLAAQVVLKLEGSVETTLFKYVASGNPTLFVPALEELRRSARALRRAPQAQGPIDSLLREAMSDPNQEKRGLAARVVIDLWDRDCLERFLDEYTAKSPYYYNVVCMLDRALYAPTRMRAALLGGLRAEDT